MGEPAACRRCGCSRNWAIVYVGNFVGALATAALLYAGSSTSSARARSARPALTIAATKTSYGFGQAIALGMLCNALVCLAVWLCYSARTTTDKILAIVPPITAFVAAGFEHSVANMYFIPFGLLVKSDDGIRRGAQGARPLRTSRGGTSWSPTSLPVTIGNVIGGALMVGAIYWFVYLRGGDARREVSARS